MAPLRYAAKFDPFLSLDCAPTPSTLAQSKERKGSNFAIWQPCVQDLLTTVNIPEWPAAELLLSLLGRVLREKFKDKSTEMALRISSLEYLGTVSARLRKDAVQSKLKLE